MNSVSVSGLRVLRHIPPHPPSPFVSAADQSSFSWRFLCMKTSVWWYNNSAQSSYTHHSSHHSHLQPWKSSRWYSSCVKPSLHVRLNLWSACTMCKFGTQHEQHSSEEPEAESRLTCVHNNGTSWDTFTGWWKTNKLVQDEKEKLQLILCFDTRISLLKEYRVLAVWIVWDQFSSTPIAKLKNLPKNHQVLCLFL